MILINWYRVNWLFWDWIFIFALIVVVIFLRSMRRIFRWKRLQIHNIEKMKIFANGKLAYNLMKKHFPQYDVEYLCSTSSANVRFDIEQWLKIRQYL